MPPGDAPRLVAGLGNPGARYVGTRHNVGFLVADELARRIGAPFRHEPKWAADVARGDGLFVVKPMTFMNLSGQAVGAIARFYKLSATDVLAVVDDTALPLGRLRLRPAGSHGGHNGLRSLAEHLDTDGFPRLRFGVGAPPPEMDLSAYVLRKFAPSESDAVAGAVARAADACQAAARSGVEAAMNFFNQKTKEQPAQ